MKYHIKEIAAIKFVAIVLVVFFLKSCSMKKRFKMPNVVGGDYIDVTNLITKEGYMPVYCGPQKILCALINPQPTPLQIEYEEKLKSGLGNWVLENKSNVDVNALTGISLIGHSTYQYSYLITYYPVDVYKTEVLIGVDTISAFFRMDRGNLMLPYDDDGWVIF